MVYINKLMFLNIYIFVKIYKIYRFLYNNNLNNLPESIGNIKNLEKMY